MSFGMYQGRTGQGRITLYDSKDEPVVLPETALLRLQITRIGHAPEVDLWSDQSTANGSFVTLDNPLFFFLHQGDADFEPGIYDMSVCIYDSSAAGSPVTHVSKGHFVMYNSLGEGDVIVGPDPETPELCDDADLPTTWFFIPGDGQDVGKVATELEYELPTGGTTYNVSAATTTADLQLILDGLQDNDVVILDKDGVWDSLVFRKVGTGWKYIISSDMASLPDFGERVDKTDASFMPTIRTTNPGGNLYPAINTEVGASYYHFAGIRVEQQSHPGVPKPRMWMLGRVPVGGTNGTLHPTDLGATYETVGNNIIIDRCIFHGDNTNSYRGLYFDANDSVVIGCYFHRIFVDPTVNGFSDENIGIEIDKIAGRQLIQNNYIAAGGINVMLGSNESYSQGIPPMSDIVVRNNTLDKDSAWASILATHPGSSSLKNHIEIKNGNRVLWEDNTLTNQFFGNQGRSVVVKVGPSGETDNVTIRNNTVSNVTGGISITNDTAAQRIGSVTVRGNTFTGIGQQPGTTDVDDTIIIFSDGLPIECLIMEDNVFTRNVPTEESHIDIRNSQTGVTDFTYRNNTSPAGEYGIKASGTASGVASLNVLATNWQFTDNTITNSTGLDYPPDNSLS